MQTGATHLRTRGCPQLFELEGCWWFVRQRGRCRPLHGLEADGLGLCAEWRWWSLELQG